MSLESICGMPIPRRIHIVLLMVLSCPCAAGVTSGRPDLKIVLPEREHPCLACTAEELGRLQRAYHLGGAEREVVAAYVKRAERFLDDPVDFPARGGQHNQWYQCDACQMALTTLDATHHQCPKCKKVYSGPPYDDVIFSGRHGRNLQQMVTAAWAYAISREVRFAEYAAGVLLGYSERYRDYPYHSASRETQSSWGRKAGGHLFEQTLTEASSLATYIGPAYDLIHDSGVLLATDHRKIREGLLMPMLRNIDRNQAGKSNWQTWHNAAMLWGGALVHDPAWVRKAIADSDNGFYHQVDVSVSKEGMWYENSWGYHFYTLQALVNMAETARRLDVDLWSDERLKRMFTLPVQYTMADGMLPRFGDDVNSSVGRVGRLFEPAYHAYGDPQILALLNNGPRFETVLLGRDVRVTTEPPLLKSIVFEDAGHAILRGHGPARLTAAMTFGPYGGFHGHYDKLSFVFFGYGHELGVDAGRARSQAYRLPIHTNWYKATISHNAVLVDGRSQKPATGKLRLFEPESDYTAVAASCDDAYPGVRHTRWLIMTDTYLLVCDRLHSDTERRFDWLYHNRGKQVICDGAREPASLPWTDPGGEYIRDAKQGATDAVIRIRFEDTNITTYLTMAAWRASKVVVGEGVGASVADRVPMAVIGREGAEACFAAALEPTSTGSRPHIADMRCTETGQGLAIIIEGDRGIDRVRIALDHKVSVVLSR